MLNSISNQMKALLSMRMIPMTIRTNSERFVIHCDMLAPCHIKEVSVSSP